MGNVISFPETAKLLKAGAGIKILQAFFYCPGRTD
jgi:hypothetical protein